MDSSSDSVTSWDGVLLFHSSSIIWETRNNVSTYFRVQVQKDTMHKVLKQGFSNCDIKVILSRIEHQLSRKVFSVGNKEHISLSLQDLWALNVNATLRNSRMACKLWHWRLFPCHKIQLESSHSLHCVLVQLYSLDFQAPDHSQLPN